jgi:hypothetical protein
MGIVKDIMHLDSTRWDQDTFDKEQAQWILVFNAIKKHHDAELTRDEIARQIRVNITLFGQCS